MRFWFQVEQEIRVKKIYGESMMIEISFSRLVSVLSSIFDNLYRAFITQNENEIVTYHINLILLIKLETVLFLFSKEEKNIKWEAKVKYWIHLFPFFFEMYSKKNNES